MSPEQARGQTNLTAKSDQFLLGLVLYELAAGRRAFQRDSTAETMWQLFARIRRGRY
jgi:serine/threonine-protein kinase